MINLWLFPCVSIGFHSSAVVPIHGTHELIWSLGGDIFSSMYNIHTHIYIYTYIYIPYMTYLNVCIYIYYICDSGVLFRMLLTKIK